VEVAEAVGVAEEVEVEAVAVAEVAAEARRRS
jgi:hypothetical protein